MNYTERLSRRKAGDASPHLVPTQSSGNPSNGYRIASRGPGPDLVKFLPMSQVRTLQRFELYRKICWDYVNSRGHDLDTRFQQHFPKIKHPPGLNTWRVSFPRFFHPATLHAAPRSYSPARNFALPAGFELVDEQDREVRRSADHACGKKACAAGDGVHRLHLTVLLRGREASRPSQRGIRRVRGAPVPGDPGGRRPDGDAPRGGEKDLGREVMIGIY